MRSLEILGGVAALALLAAPALSKQQTTMSSPSGPPTADSSSCNPASDPNCSSSMPSEAPVAPGAMAPATSYTPDTTAAATPVTIPSGSVATPAPVLSAAATPNTPSRLYVARAITVSGATIEVVTNGPVPDTRDNRQRFGGPMSRAGRKTAPRGN